MADPARYHIDIIYLPDGGGYDLMVERGESGKWVKWLDFVDYKSAQRNNRSEQTAIKLGLEVVALKAENERLRKASFVTAVPAEHYDRVVEAADAMRDCVDPDTFPNVIAAYNAAKEGRDAK